MDRRLRALGALSLAGAVLLGSGVPAAAQITVEEFCAAIADGAGAEGATASPAVEAAASPGMEAAASPPIDAVTSPGMEAGSPPIDDSATSGMSPETMALLSELCSRAGLGAAAASDGEASAAPMESPAASIAAEASPAAA